MDISPIGSNVSAPVINTSAPIAIDEKVKAAIADSSEKDAKATPNQRDVEAAVKILNEFTATLPQTIEFSVEEETGKTVVKVIDAQTNEILRQIPTVEALEIARSVQKMQGFLIYEKA